MAARGKVMRVEQNGPGYVVAVRVTTYVLAEAPSADLPDCGAVQHAPARVPPLLVRNSRKACSRPEEAEARYYPATSESRLVREERPRGRRLAGRRHADPGAGPGRGPRAGRRLRPESDRCEVTWRLPPDGLPTRGAPPGRRRRHRQGRPRSARLAPWRAGVALHRAVAARLGDGGRGPGRSPSPGGDPAGQPHRPP